MIKTYRYFHKKQELFLGLSFFSLLKVAAGTLLLLFLCFKLGLTLNHPLFLLAAIFWMLVIALIIRADSGEEVKGFYSSILLHPFAEHVYPNYPYKYLKHKSLLELIGVSQIADDHIKMQSGDLVSIIKIDKAKDWLCLDEDQKNKVAESWLNYLRQLENLELIESYSSSQLKRNQLQIFIEIRATKPKIQKYQTESEAKEQQRWLKDLQQKSFIPEYQFYLLVKQKNPEKQKAKYLRFFAELRNKIFKQEPRLVGEEELAQLREKQKLSISYLESLGIHCELVKNKDLEDFYEKHIFSKQTKKHKLEDHGNYLFYRDYYSKTFRLKQSPEAGDLSLWLGNLLSKINSHAELSIELESRDAQKDRRKLENRLKLMQELKHNKKTSSLEVQKEFQSICKDLLEKKQSFDISIVLTIKSKSLDELKKKQLEIKKELSQYHFDELKRQQVKNWLTALPLASNRLCPEERLYSSYSFAGASFPFLENNLGTEEGALLGLSVQDGKLVYLDEYQKDKFHNRHLNFIGDSGSGKSVAAKLAVKRRLANGGSFSIIDCSVDGWKFFIDYYDGKVIEIDSSSKEEAFAYFNPLRYGGSTDSELFNQHIERLLKLLNIIKERESKLSLKEELFFTEKLRELYQTVSQPRLSDLYRLLQKSACEISNNWLNYLAPFCNASQGIYASLMDGTKAVVDEQEKLTLFSLAKIENDSNLLPVVLYLVADHLSYRLIHKKESKITLIVDEAWKVFSGEKSQKAKDLLTYFARAGRAMDLGLWTISQKPGDIPREVHSSASISLCFQLKEERDKQEIASLCSFSAAEAKLLYAYNFHQAGTCFIKTTQSSGLIRVLVDPLEEALCNSSKNFVEKREALQNKYAKNLNQSQAAQLAVEELVRQNENH